MNNNESMKYFDINANSVRNGECDLNILFAQPEYIGDFCYEWSEKNGIEPPDTCLSLIIEIKEIINNQDLFKIKDILIKIYDDIEQCNAPDSVKLAEVSNWGIAYKKVEEEYERIGREIKDKYFNKIIAALGDTVEIRFYVQKS